MKPSFLCCFINFGCANKMQIPCRLDNVFGVSGNMEGSPTQEQEKKDMECSKPKIKPKGERCAKVNRRSKWAVVGCHALVHIYASMCVCVCLQHCLQH